MSFVLLSLMLLGCSNNSFVPSDGLRDEVAPNERIGSCVDSVCGASNPAEGGNCYCDVECENIGDCCNDYADICVANPTGCEGGELPNEIAFSGSPSSVIAAFVDEDECQDLVVFVAGTENAPSSAHIEILWGDFMHPYSERLSISLNGELGLTPLGRADTRDTSSNLLRVKDVNGDSRRDVMTASGVALSDGDRQFIWQSFPGNTIELGLPMVALGNSTSIFRGTQRGVVERCDLNEGCQLLDGESTSLCDPEIVGCAVEDIELADFNGDGHQDLLAGGPPVNPPFVRESRLWFGPDYSNAVAVPIDAADFEVGDINQDGLDDVVAQMTEFDPNFPSHSLVWISQLEGDVPFVKSQEFVNFDNHTDNAELADVNGDGCLDFMMIGVDIGNIGIRPGNLSNDGGCLNFLGSHDPSAPFDTQSSTVVVEGKSSIGIQQIDLKGDGELDWILRDSVEPLIHILAPVEIP